MFPCCQLCYEEYIDKDGYIDFEKLNNAIKKYEDEYNHRVIIKNKTVCNCECHKVGSKVLH